MRAVITVAALAAAAAPLAAQQAFTGVDVGTGVGVPSVAFAPNSFAARTNWLASIYTPGLAPTITFETTTLGQIPGGGRTLAPGVTVTVTNQSLVVGGVTTVSGDQLGWNTTSGGSRYLQAAGTLGGVSTVSFNFSTPINFFGAYVTGVETNLATWTVTSPAGTGITLANTLRPGIPTGTAGTQFVGFTSATPVSTVTFRSQGATLATDFVGFDDVQYGVVPEPSTYVMLATGLAALAVAAKRRRK